MWPQGSKPLAAGHCIISLELEPRTNRLDRQLPMELEAEEGPWQRESVAGDQGTRASNLGTPTPTVPHREVSHATWTLFLWNPPHPLPCPHLTLTSSSPQPHFTLTPLPHPTPIPIPHHAACELIQGASTHNVWPHSLGPTIQPCLQAPENGAHSRHDVLCPLL